MTPKRKKNNDTEYEDKSIARHKSTRNGETKSRELSLTLNEIGNLIPNVISYKSNFTMKNILHSCLLKGN